MASRALLFWFLAGSSALLPSCDLMGLADIGDTLLDPDAALLDRPGRRIAPGIYSNLMIDGSTSSGGYVIARRWDADEARVAIVPFLDGDGCEITPGYAFERIASRVDQDLEGLVAVLRDDAERGRISLVGFDCKSRMQNIDDSRLPRVLFPAEDPRGMLAVTGAGNLILIDAVRAQTIEIASDVTAAQVFGTRIYTIENGELTVRDEDFDVVDRFGTDVGRFVFTGGDEFEVAFEDASGVSIWNEDDGAQTLSPDACSTQSLGPDVIAYHSPCGTGRLNVVTRGTRVGSTERVRLVGPEAVIGVADVLVRFGMGTEPSEITFLTSSDSESDTGVLHHATVPPNPETTDGVFPLETTVLSENAHLSAGEIYLDWDGKKGTLVEFERDDDDVVTGLFEVARGVAQLPGGSATSPRGVLVDYDGRVGRLVLLTRDGSSYEERELGTGVPIQNQQIESETGEVAFIGDVDSSGRGTLYLYTWGEPRAVAENVLVDTARYLEDPAGIVYLARARPNETAELHAWLRDSELDLLISENVSEYRTVPWPSPGVLYSVTEGDEAGLWFSKAR